MAELDDVTYISDMWPDLHPDYEPYEGDPGDETDYEQGAGGVTSPVLPNPPRKPGGAAVEMKIPTLDLELVGCS